MSSANGYVLQVDGYELRSSWAAPFYVLVRDAVDEPSEPLLIHCEDRASADRKAEFGGLVLDAEFNRA